MFITKETDSIVTKEKDSQKQDSTSAFFPSRIKYAILLPEIFSDTMKFISCKYHEN